MGNPGGKSKATDLSTHSSASPCSGIPMALPTEHTHLFFQLSPLFFTVTSQEQNRQKGASFQDFTRTVGGFLGQSKQTSTSCLCLFALELSSHSISRTFNLASRVGHPPTHGAGVSLSSWWINSLLKVILLLSFWYLISQYFYLILIFAIKLKG